MFCSPCFLFSGAWFNGKFVFSPFCNWKKAIGTSHGVLKGHSLSQAHQPYVEQAVTFIAVIEKNKQSIKSQLSKGFDKQVQLNMRALLSITDSIQFLVKQGLALTGRNWDKCKKRGDGNLTSLLDFLSKYTVLISSLIFTDHPKMQVFVT